MPGVDKWRLEKFRKGELRFTQVFDVDATQVASLLVCSHNLFSEGKLDQARKILGGLVILDPQNAYAHNLLGAVYQKMRNLPMAVFCYTRAIELFPNDVNALTNRGEVYLELGKFQEAAPDLKKAIELDPESKNPSAARARALVSMAAESLIAVRKRKAS